MRVIILAMQLLFEAFLLGLIGGAVPGPILTGTFAEILNTGFMRGLRIIFYALVAETFGAVLVVYVFYKFGLSNTVIQIISFLGSIVLLWLAMKVWNINKINSEGKNILSFKQIIILTALNSGYWIFWITIGVPRALLLDQYLAGGKLIFLFVLEFGWLAMTVFLAFVFFKFRPLLERKNLISVTFKMLAVVIALLGIKTLLSIF